MSDLTVIEQLQIQLDSLKEENQSFGNVLAIIHRDGGHYITKHGHDKASKDAIKIIYGLHSENEQLNNSRREFERLYKNKIKFAKQLKNNNEQLRKALIQHRQDLHGRSNRPCGTCKISADALGINVPDECARYDWDKKALENKSKRDSEREKEIDNRSNEKV